MKTLVVFYSSSGTTRRAGEAIAAQLGADVEDILEVKPRHLDVNGPGGIGKLAKIMAAGGEANLGMSVPIQPAVHNPAEYDLVVLGTPTWGGSLPGPVRSYIAAHRNEFKSVAFFATCSGSKPSERCYAQLRQASGQDPRATATFQSKDVLGGDVARLVASFASQLK